MTFVLKDELLDAQLLRVTGTAPYGGADLGECLAAARRVRGSDLTSWYQEWSATAAAAQEIAQRCRVAGDLESARLAFLRASNYHRNAGVMLLGAPLDPRLVEATARQTEAFQSAAALMPVPPEELEIPYEGTTLPGYFFRCADDRAPRPTVILTGGYDGTCEELYFWNAAAALARGYNVVAFDGPGQGRALVQGGLTMRADWEHVIGPVLDHMLDRPEVDRGRVALIGLSLGAYLAPRAASAEHRLAACIADCGAFDLHQAMLARMPGPLRSRVESRDRAATAAFGRILGVLARKPTAGWVLRRAMLVHGLERPVDLFEATRDFTLAGRAEHIRCPTLVCYADEDDISESAPQLAAALTCPHELIKFTAAEGAGDHCEAGARQLYHARTFAWLDRALA
jgi:alpha-beta hydrolase superfamily lysophospholipase